MKSSVEHHLNRWIESIMPRRMMTGLFLVTLITRLLLIPINRAEYTDGILQITLFSSPNKLYPPLFTVLVQILKPLFGNPEYAGRFVSAVSSSCVIFPVYLIAKRMFDKRAAFFASLLYAVSPISLRWSVHAMTDALFSLLFILSAGELWKSAMEDIRWSGRIVLATILAVIATLTRYQGILIFPLIIMVLIHKAYNRRKRIILPSLVQLLWLLPVIWIFKFGFRHPEQFAERAGTSLGDTALNILNVFESFTIWSPYFFTWPVFFLFLTGLYYLKWEKLPRRILFYEFAILAFMLLLLQSAFSSFQSRYLLPLLPFIVIFAGWGLVSFMDRPKGSGWLFKILLMVTLLYNIGFSGAVLILQRESFADIKDAALFVSEYSEETPVYSNETYKDLGPVKMRFWSGRAIRHLENPNDIQEGALVSVSSAYGGTGAFKTMTQWLRNQRGARLAASFESRLVPFLPDIMQEPYTHQNPLAMTFRYTPQNFRTDIYYIPETGSD